MASTNVLKMVPEQGWRSGFSNLFRQANGRFWHTRKWLVQTIFWLIFINGFLAVLIWPAAAELTAAREVAIPANLTPMQALQYDPFGDPLIMIVVFLGLGIAVSAVIASQDAIIGERQSGTAAWVLSKPVTRPAFILSRLAASAIAIIATGVVFQLALAYTQLSLLAGAPWPIAGFLGAMGLMVLLTMFYVTLTFMLGSIFKNRGPVMGIGMFLGLVGPAILVKAVPILGLFTPWSFIMDDPYGNLPMALALIKGQPISILPVIGTALMCVAFTAVAILRFRREEF